ncbi:WGR domain-containing protein [Deinococcus sp. UYEF24]
MADTTYLEYSDPDGAEHKFYETVVDGAELAIRYGRIGTDGQRQLKTCATPEQAQAEAAKKLREKRRKGYQDAVAGVRQKREVVRRTVTETKSTTQHAAPLLWRFKTSAAAFGIFVDAERVWAGNEAGDVYSLSLAGEVEASLKLPDGVKCLVRDGHWTFAGCDDGNVYDLSGKLPFVAYTAQAHSALLWMDIQGGMLGVSDQHGSVYAFDAESDQQWGNVGQGASMGWMVRVDEAGVYYGHSRGVGMYDRASGLPVWEQKTRGEVLFGWQDGAGIYAGTTARLIQRFTKAGAHVQDYACDASVLSCATSVGGEYVFAGDSGSAIYCFRQDGTRLWKLGTGGTGSALSMQYAADRLYVVTVQGYLAAIDASPAAIEAAQGGVTPTVQDIKMLASVTAQTPRTSLGVTDDVSAGMVLICTLEGGKLRVHAQSAGYQPWNVQFPRDLREAGAKYVVDDLSDAGGFYRVVGEIRRLSA